MGIANGYVLSTHSDLLAGSAGDATYRQETWQGEQKEQKSSSKRHEQLPPFPFPSAVQGPELLTKSDESANGKGSCRFAIACVTVDSGQGFPLARAM